MCVGVGDDMWRPRQLCNVTGSRDAETIFEEPGALPAKPACVFFHIAEAGELSILKGPRSIRTRRCKEACWPVAHSGNDLPRIIEHRHEHWSNRRIHGHVLHRAVTLELCKKLQDEKKIPAVL
jgi:hypothetical protein